MEELFDVIAVNRKTLKIDWVEENRTRNNADAVVSMAVIRQGTKERFFLPVPAGQYKRGDTYIKPTVAVK
jgi:hypothetical protein